MAWYLKMEAKPLLFLACRSIEMDFLTKIKSKPRAKFVVVKNHFRSNRVSSTN